MLSADRSRKELWMRVSRKPLKQLSFYAWDHPISRIPMVGDGR